MHRWCDILAEKFGTYGIDIQNMVGISGDIDRLSLGGYRGESSLFHGNRSHE